MPFDILKFLEKKRDGQEHDPESIRSFIAAITGGAVPDYQVGAWLMAAYIRGMTVSELRELTISLADSGHRVRLADGWRTADKHSTGGVGDKTSLVVVPLAASLGVRVAKMSGRGLGFTGGTLDKLEAIPGFRTHISLERFISQVGKIGCAINGHTAELAPAEGVLYSMRDVTATVPSLPLIASSIVSKKLAGGASSFVFDVKTGNGALMETIESARELAVALVELSRSVGMEAVALLTCMDQPLGRTVGNALEVIEAIETLENKGPSDTTALCVEIAGEMAFVSGLASTQREGIARARRALESGEAHALFLLMVGEQGGDVAACAQSGAGIRVAPNVHALRAGKSGVVSSFHTRAIGEGVKRLGGGRMHLDDVLDLSVGVVLHKKIGDAVASGDVLLDIRYSDARQLESALPYLESCVEIGKEGTARPVVIGRVPERL